MHSRLLSACIFGGLSLVLWYVLPESGHREIDSSAYEQLSDQFFQGDVGTLPGTGWGYGVVLAGLRYIVGQSTGLIVLFHVLCVLLCLLLLYSIAYQVFDRKTADIAVFLLSINMGFLLYTQLVMTEIVYVTLLMLFAERVVIFFVQHNRRDLYMAAGALGISVWVKPAAIYYGVAFFVTCACMGYGIGSLMLFLLCIFGYVLVTGLVFGSFSLPPLQQVNMYYYFLPKVIASVDCISRTDAVARVYACGDQWSLLVSYVFTHPITAMGIWFFNVAKTVFGFFFTQLAGMHNPGMLGNIIPFEYAQQSVWERFCSYGVCGSWVLIVAGLEIVFSCIRWLLVVYAGYALVREKRWWTLLFVCSYTVYFAAITGPDGYARLRMPFEWVFLVLAARGASRFFAGRAWTWSRGTG